MLSYLPSYLLLTYLLFTDLITEEYLPMFSFKEQTLDLGGIQSD